MRHAIATRDLTQGSIPRHLLALGGPVFFAMFLQSVYALVDLGWVRSLGQDAVAGLSISLQAFFIILAISQIVATTALAEVSRAYGEGRLDDARGYTSAFALVGVGVGIASGLVAYLTSSQYVSAFTASDQVYDLGLGYFQVTTITYFTQVLLVVLGSCLRASGDFVTPVIYMVVSVALNAALDPAFIFGWGPIPAMGIDGAAWATVLAQLVACLGYVYRLSGARKDPRALYFRRPKRPQHFWRRLGTRGFPAGVQFFLLSAVLGVVLGAVKPFGAAWTATAGGGFRVLQQAFLPLVALGSATAALTGQNLGARQPERAKLAIYTSLRWATGFALVLGVLLYFFGDVAAFFFAQQPDEYELGAVYFRWSAPSLLAFGAVYIPTFALQAAGQAILPLTAAVLRVLLLVICVAVIIPALELPPVWVFGAVTATAFVEGAADLLLVRRFLARVMRRTEASLAPAGAPPELAGRPTD